MRGLARDGGVFVHGGAGADIAGTADLGGAAGRTASDAGPDTVIVNTCAVTAEAERQARQTIRRIARERPDSRIVVTGCAAQIDPASWSALPNVHRVTGQRRETAPGELDRRCRLRAQERRRGRARGDHGRRHHDRAGNRGPPGDRVRRPGARFRPGAARLRSPLHVLRHPVWPRAEPLRADGRGGGAGTHAGGARVPRGGADRGGHRLLWP